MDSPYSPGPSGFYGPTYSSNINSSFKLDEGFSEDTRSQYDNVSGSFAANGPAFEEWVMAQSEGARAGKITISPSTPAMNESHHISGANRECES